MATKSTTEALEMKESSLPADLAAIVHIGEARAAPEPRTNPDGSITHFIAEAMKTVTVPALNPVLPDSVHQTEVFIEPDSFIQYLQQYASSQAICRASLGGNKIEGVLDYHGRARENAEKAVPSRCAHTATLNCPFDVDYQKWRPLLEGKFMKQKDFIEFMQEMIHTVHQPAAADLLDIAGDVSIDRVLRFRSARNDRSGNVSFVFDEQDGEGGAQGGEVKLPEFVEIVAPIFQGGIDMRITARLRYRLDNGALLLGVHWPGMDKHEREAFRTIGERVGKEAAVAVFYVA